MKCILETYSKVISWRDHQDKSYGFTSVHYEGDVQINMFNKWINNIVKMKQDGDLSVLVLRRTIEFLINI